MAILSLSDQSTYFPGVTLSGGELLAAVASATLRAEGPQGADRKLSVTDYTEFPSFCGDTFFLSYWPLVLDGTGKPVVEIQYRVGSGVDGFGRSAPHSNRYQTLDPTFYEVDPSTGQVLLYQDTGLPFVVGLSEIGSRYRGVISRLSDYGENRVSSDVRVKYRAGFDFGAASLSEEAKTIKALVSEVMAANNAISSNYIKKETVTDFHSFEYATDSTERQAEASLQASLQALKMYAARSSSG